MLNQISITQFVATLAVKNIRCCRSSFSSLSLSLYFDEASCVPRRSSSFSSASAPPSQPACLCPCQLCGVAAARQLACWQSGWRGAAVSARSLSSLSPSLSCSHAARVSLSPLPPTAPPISPPLTTPSIQSWERCGAGRRERERKRKGGGESERQREAGSVSVSVLPSPPPS